MADLQSGVATRFEHGRRPASLLSMDYMHLLADDTRDLLTAPARWDRQDWMLAGALTGLVAVSSTMDGQIKREAQEHLTHDLSTLTKKTQRFGAEYSFLVLGGFEAVGVFADNPKAEAVAMDGLTASVIAAGIITPVLKIGIGRVRPNAAARTFDFKPFGGTESFPSGHATQAFAVASVIASHYDQWWVQGTAYGLAGLVGYSRIEQNAHFASDVVAGAVIGTVVGRAIVKRHNTPMESTMAIIPYSDGRSTGLVFAENY